MYKFLMSTVVAGTMALATNVYAACGSISMADMNWPSATLMANVDKIILEEAMAAKSKWLLVQLLRLLRL